MYNDTDWNSIGLKTELPNEIFTGEMDEEKWKSHVGKHIVVTRYGDHWTEIHEAPAFVPGVKIDFAEDLLKLGADTLNELVEYESVSSCFNCLSAAINAMMLDDVPKNDIKHLFNIEYKSNH